ncbi:hypothetical protein ACJMK2_001940 [Sinanodonta woodiana]|uniref:DDE Tnp4 domain-containing protein n=1 Tax=Sinanodonta woodiana TaxID=1069815 RepID=A0ABD3XTR4_SINWO
MIGYALRLVLLAEEEPEKPYGKNNQPTRSIQPCLKNQFSDQNCHVFGHHRRANIDVIERFFGLPLGRFRRLKNLRTVLVKTAVIIIIKCCVVHNACPVHHEEVDDFMQVNENLADNQGTIHVVDIEENDAKGVLKRHFIAKNIDLAQR